MILIFTGNEQLDNELNKKIKDSRIVYYSEYVLEEKEAKILITAVQNNKYNFEDFLFKVRNKNIRVILILENESVKELSTALQFGIYDILFDPFSIEDTKAEENTTSGQTSTTTDNNNEEMQEEIIETNTNSDPKSTGTFFNDTGKK